MNADTSSTSIVNNTETPATNTEASTDTNTETSIEMNIENSTEMNTDINIETSTDMNAETSTEMNTETSTEMNTETSTEMNTETSTEALHTEVPTAVVKKASKPASPKKRKKIVPKTFKSAFEILKTNANQLQQQSEPDIDNLMTTVEESISAYKVCQERIDAVQSALDAAFATDIAEPSDIDQTTQTTSDKNTDSE